MPRVTLVVVAEALRMSHYCNQSAFGGIHSIVNGGRNSLSGG